MKRIIKKQFLFMISVVVINYLDKIVFGSNATNMACVATYGATVLSIERFLKEIVEDN
ncbi:MAG: hypothetical protein JXC31_05830 [Acholeplasmataceae bacterium]|nr:hypothetical protein [Acholeplasmataceae bacterium]